MIDIVWPSDYHYITQGWMANPAVYRKFQGLLGHDGVDIRALSGSNIYAVVAGIVSEVGFRTPTHNYGYCIRLRHAWGSPAHTYETIYAHLMDKSARVHIGDHVLAGDLLGLADSTGNAPASHLHFSLKRIGATAAGETPQGFDLIDPTWLLDLARPKSG